MHVVMKPDCDFSPEDITAFLETKLEAYKIPRFIQCIDSIPKAFNGKIDRKKLIADS